MVENAGNGDGEPATTGKSGGGMTVFGRQGSPTVTFALPFSRVDVKADDAAPLVAEVAMLTARLARAVTSAGLPEASLVELAAIAEAADALASGASLADRRSPRE